MHEVAAAADLPTEPDGLAGAFVHRIGDVVLELLEALSEPRPDSGLAPVPAVANRLSGPGPDVAVVAGPGTGAARLFALDLMSQEVGACHDDPGSAAAWIWLG